MTRLALLPPLLLTLTGCFDFAGERGRLGFVTDARVDLLEAWTPAIPLARGTVVAVGVGEHLDDGRTPDEVRLTTSQRVTAGREGVVVHGDGWVQGIADGVRDHFRFEVRDAHRLTVGPIGDAGWDHDVVAVRNDGPSFFDVALRDVDGVSLGYRPMDLDVVLEHGGVDWVDGRPRLVVDGPDTLTVTWGDVGRRVQVEPVSPDDLLLDIVRQRQNGGCILVAVAAVDGRPVLDPGPVRWSHVEDPSPFAPCAEDVTVEVALP